MSLNCTGQSTGTAHLSLWHGRVRLSRCSWIGFFLSCQTLAKYVHSNMKKNETSVEFDFCLYHESWCMVQHEGLIVMEDESYTHPNKHAWHTQVVAHPSPFELQTSDCQSWIWILLKKESECMYFIKVWKRAHRDGIESKRVITRQTIIEICMHVSSRVSHLEQIFFSHCCSY
jgi:hypothetical protein